MYDINNILCFALSLKILDWSNIEPPSGKIVTLNLCHLGHDPGVHDNDYIT